MSLKRRVHPCSSLSCLIDHLERHRFQLALFVTLTMIVGAWTLGFLVPCILLTLWHDWTTWSVRYIFVPSDDVWTACATILMAAPGLVSLLFEAAASDAKGPQRAPLSQSEPSLWWWMLATRPMQTVVVNAPTAEENADVSSVEEGKAKKRKGVRSPGSSGKGSGGKGSGDGGVFSFLIVLLMVVCMVYSVYVTYYLVRDAIIDLATLQREMQREEDTHEE